MTNRLRDVRVLKRITQFRLGLQAEMNATKISFIENGLVEPRSDEKKRLSKALGVRPEEIWGVEPKEPING
jgi:transcriptional regulator with XRE-family HTH domain